MEWTADVTAGDWLRDRLDDSENWGRSMHGVVPRGFAAYARVFHPATRDRPVGAEWPPQPYSDHRAWDAFQRAHPDLDVIDERVDWATVAAALGKTMHPLAQWGNLVGIDRWADRENDPRDAEGWRYHDPEEGGMPADVLSTLAGILAAHTTTPDDGYVALWEGVGGLVGHLGTSPSRTFFQIGDASPELDHHNAMLGRSVPDPFNNVFRTATWQDGILSREISEGPRLELPGRGHVLFRGGVSELGDPDWVLSVPWRDRVAEAHGFPPSAQTPSIVWPADRAWVSVTEVDYDSTIVGGAREPIAALVADPRLEAWEIPADADLTFDADEVNR
ncbi:MAG: hypothetical protein P0Y48_11905 [Candidatus Microbacterium phytovorans]|uniref:Uncharacterized protein n=1 Tax=Candidatus Microbacterium phytovorans TaxID=3121374 RepID=A0AAJ5W1Z0_9MICO|nr:hypothetical protein [Microbacterium sp.]WEK13156.1 MAG: hypothetical protein P0Y48_11905 [Microbacterium sp.]